MSTSDHGYSKEIHDSAEKPEGSETTILNPGAPLPKSHEAAGYIIVADENFGVPSSVESNGIAEAKLEAPSHGEEPFGGEYKQLTDNVGYAYVAPNWMHMESAIEDQADWVN